MPGPVGRIVSSFSTCLLGSHLTTESFCHRAQPAQNRMVSDQDLFCLVERWSSEGNSRTIANKSLEGCRVYFEESKDYHDVPISSESAGAVEIRSESVGNGGVESEAGNYRPAQHVEEGAGEVNMSNFHRLNFRGGNCQL